MTALSIEPAAPFTDDELTSRTVPALDLANAIAALLTLGATVRLRGDFPELPRWLVSLAARTAAHGMRLSFTLTFDGQCLLAPISMFEPPVTGGDS